MKLKLTDEMKVIIGIIIFIGILCFVSWCIDKIKPRSKSYTNEELDKIHSTLLSILERSLPIFEKYNINYWSSAGTLLGSVREGKIIDWDDDIDLAVIKNDYLQIKDNEELHKDLDLVGLTVITSEGRGENALLKIVNKQENYSKDKIFIDIMCYEKNEDKYILSNLVEKSWWPTSFYKIDEVFPLQKGILNHININIPLKPEKYLERFYGKDWIIPKEVHNHKDEINVIL